jgi:hypothetical protein
LKALPDIPLVEIIHNEARISVTGRKLTLRRNRFSTNAWSMDRRDDRDWELYARALDIYEGRLAGHALPIIRKLVRRRFAPAVTILSDYVSEAEGIRLLRAAARQGDATSAYNLAITHRNRGDMLRYRTELGRAARRDPYAALELRRFKTRFPEEVMRRCGRLAPDRAGMSAMGGKWTFLRRGQPRSSR